jgi:hypothetical protein
MRFLSGKLSTILIAAPFLCASTLMATAQQSPGPAPQHLELKDPTPRPPDLKKQYENDPADKARQQQAAMLRNAQIMEQVTKATDKLCQLAQELRNDVAKNAQDAPPPRMNAAKAGQIEKLAKSVKEKMQMQ